MISKFKNYMVLRGIPTTEISSNLLEFKYNGLSFLFEGNPNNDASYFRILVPNIETSEIDDSIRKKMIHITTSFKVGKCIQVNNQVWLSIEVISFSKELLEPLFQRMLEILCQMYNEYRNYVE